MILPHAIVYLAAGSVLAGLGHGQYEDSSQLNVEVGAANILKRDGPQAPMLRLEYRSPKRLWRIQPMAGAFIDGKGAAYAYTGIYKDFAWGPHLVFSPSIAVGLYSKGNSKDLGGPIEFQSGVNLMYKLTSHNAVGLSLRHLSNAGIYRINGGTETLTAVYSHTF